MFDFTKLEEINAVVNAAGLNDKRKRNEAIQLGLSNPTQFSNTYSNVISDFNNQTNQFSQDFTGAGRQLASNQDWDKQNPDLASMFGSATQRLDDGLYYYGNTDPTLSKWFDYKNPGDYTTKDVSPGKYEIFNTDNTSLGYGYKSWQDAIRELGIQNAKKYISNVSPSYSGMEQGYEGALNPISYTEQQYKSMGSPRGFTFNPGGFKFSGPQQTWNDIDWGGGAGGWSQHGGYGYTKPDTTPWDKVFTSEDELINALTNSGYFDVTSKDFYGKDNTLSDLQLAEVFAQMLQKNLPYAVDSTSWRDIGQDRKLQSLSGDAAMMGSLPFLFNNQLLGYKENIAPATGGRGAVNDVSQQILDLNGKTQSNATLGRQFDEAALQGVASKINDKNILISPEGVSKFKYSQPESYQFEVQEDDGGFLGLGDFGNLALMLGGGYMLGPAGLGLDAMTSGAIMGGLGSAVNDGNILEGALLGGLGGYGMSKLAGTSFMKDLAGTTGIPVNALSSGGMSALSAAIRGGNPITSGFSAGLGSIFGNYIGNETQNPNFGKMAGIAGTAGLSSLFNKNGRSPGEAFLNSALVNTNNMQNNVERKPDPETEAFLVQQNRLNRIKQQQLLGKLNG